MEPSQRHPQRSAREYIAETWADRSILDEFERLAKYCPEVLEGHMALRQSAFMEQPQGVLPQKTKELLAVAIQCAMRETDPPPTFHARRAIDAGATPHEVAEVVSLCIMLRGPGTFWQSGRYALQSAEERAMELGRGAKGEEQMAATSRPPILDAREYAREYYVDQARLNSQEQLARYCPEVLEGYMTLRQGVFMEPPHGALSLKVKELLAVAIECAVLKTNRPPTFHAGKAIEAGATPQEIAEVLSLCIALSGMITYAESGKWALQAAIERANELAGGLVRKEKP